jgi:uncharacterized membrane protein YqjE
LAADEIPAQAMSVEPGASPADNPQIGEFPSTGVGESLPKNWGEALVGLVASRAAIASLEAKEATAFFTGKLVSFLIALVCLVGVWALTLAGAIGGIAAVTEWEWYHIAFAAAGVHFLIVLVALMIAKAKRPAPFPVTRAEFEKDREWLNQLKKTND